MVVNLPPVTGNTELDQWTYDVTTELEDGVPTSGGGGNIPQPIPGDAGSRQWAAKYLDVAYGTDRSGAEFTRSFTSLNSNSATAVWVGYRNQESSTPEINNAAGFNWYELIIPEDRTGLFAYYRTIGGRRVSFVYAENPPTNFKQYTGAPPINLDELPFGSQGPQGLDGLFVFITTEDGKTFKNNSGARKRLTANLNKGGILPTESEYDSYEYTWTYNKDVVCIDTNRNVLASRDSNNREVPLVATGEPDALVCTFGNPATTTQNTVSGVLRDVIVGPEEVSTTLRLGCSITNIP